MQIPQDPRLFLGFRCSPELVPRRASMGMGEKRLATSKFLKTRWKEGMVGGMVGERGLARDAGAFRGRLGSGFVDGGCERVD